MRFSALTIAALALLGSNGAAAERFVQDRLAIGFWVDPPMDERAEERYREIAEAHFTMVIGGFGARTEEAVARQLALCEQFGLKAIVNRRAVPAESLPDSPACWGYAIQDEPKASDFARLRARIDEIRKHRPGKLGYINLFPDYASPKQLGTANYEEHVRRFIEEVDPDVLSMDHYPFMRPDKDTREGYCENLEVMRKYALAQGIPFWNFFNTMPFGNHFDPTEAQLRWQVFASLAHGAKGVMYFCYYTPLSGEFPKGGAIIGRDDRPTRHYEQAKRINTAIRQLGPVLMQLTSTSVRRLRRGEDRQDLLQGTPLRHLDDGDFILGCFQHKDGRKAVMVVNDDPGFTAWPTAVFAVPNERVLEVSPKTGDASPVIDDSPNMDGLQISLDAGEGRLFILEDVK